MRSAMETQCYAGWCAGPDGRQKQARDAVDRHPSARTHNAWTRRRAASVLPRHIGAIDGAGRDEDPSRKHRAPSPRAGAPAERRLAIDRLARTAHIAIRAITDSYRNGFAARLTGTTAAGGAADMNRIFIAASACLMLAAGPAAYDGCAYAAGACCKICRIGKACGDSCIAADKICRKGSGCACDG